MQKAEKGKVYLLFENTFQLIVSLAKRGNLWLQKEKQGKKQGEQQGWAEPLPKPGRPPKCSVPLPQLQAAPNGKG